jgi:hypothetical protein
MAPLLEFLMKKISLILLTMSSACFAQDDASVNISDFRLSVGVAEVRDYSGEFRYTEGPNSMFGTEKLEDEENPSGNLLIMSVMYQLAESEENFTILWGLGAETATGSDDFEGGNYDTNTYGLKFNGGAALQLTGALHLEFLADFGLGIIRSEDADRTLTNQIDRATASGQFIQYGVKIGAHYYLGKGFSLGVETSASRFNASTDAKFSATGGSYEANYQWLQLSAAGSLSYRF